MLFFSTSTKVELVYYKKKWLPCGTACTPKQTVSGSFHSLLHKSKSLYKDIILLIILASFAEVVLPCSSAFAFTHDICSRLFSQQTTRFVKRGEAPPPLKRSRASRRRRRAGAAQFHFLRHTRRYLYLCKQMAAEVFVGNGKQSVGGEAERTWIINGRSLFSVQ